MAIVEGAIVVTADGTVAIVLAISAVDLLLLATVTTTRIIIVGRHLRVIVEVVPGLDPDLHRGTIVEAGVLEVGIITMTVVGIAAVTAVGIVVVTVAEIVGGAIVFIVVAIALESKALRCAIPVMNLKYSIIKVQCSLKGIRQPWGQTNSQLRVYESYILPLSCVLHLVRFSNAQRIIVWWIDVPSV